MVIFHSYISLPEGKFNDDFTMSPVPRLAPLRRSHSGSDAGAAVFGLRLAGRFANSGRLVLLLCAPGDLCIAGYLAWNDGQQWIMGVTILPQHVPQIQ